MRLDQRFIWDVRTDDISGPYEDDSLLKLTLRELGDRFRAVDPPRALDINPGKYRILARLQWVPENRHWRRERLKRERRERLWDVALLSLLAGLALLLLIVFVPL